MRSFLILVSFLKLILCESCGPIDNVNFLLITGLELAEEVPLNETASLLDDPNFRKENPTVIYAFDFLEDANSTSTALIVDAFLERGDFNVLVIDYGKHAAGNYIFDAVPNAIKVRKL